MNFTTKQYFLNHYSLIDIQHSIFLETKVNAMILQGLTHLLNNKI